MTLTRDGRSVTLASYTSAVRNGVGYVPEERRTDGLALIMTVSDNIRLPNRQQLSRFGIKSPPNRCFLFSSYSLKLPS